MSDRLIKLLDEADLFLRNRANATPATLNDYDIEKLEDIAKICDEAARSLEKAIITPCKVGDTVWYLNRHYHIALRRNTVYMAKVVRIVTTRLGTSIVVQIKDNNGCCEIPEISDWGQTIFVSREEALSKLQASYEQVKGGTK